MMTDILQQWGAAATEYMLYRGYYPEKKNVFRLLLPQGSMVSANIVQPMCVANHSPEGFL
jgi:hypothetical protein